MEPANLRRQLVRTSEFSLNELLKIISSKYKLRILWDLQHGPLRFGEVRKRLSLGTADKKGISPRVLGRELKSLAGLGLVHRRAYDSVPPKVEYRLTALGRTLVPIISAMVEWGARHPCAAFTLQKETATSTAAGCEHSRETFSNR